MTVKVGEDKVLYKPKEPDGTDSCGVSDLCGNWMLEISVLQTP